MISSSAPGTPVQSPIRIFIASTASEWLPAKLLEFSILERCSLPVEVTRLGELDRAIPTPVHAKNRARTPFSFQRFLIPEACSYQGRAIYLDADMLVFRDIAQLWRLPFRQAKLLSVAAPEGERRGQFSVMLLNCESLDWRIEQLVADMDAGVLSYEQLLFEMRVAQPVALDIDPQWNCLESYSASETALLHYTDMHTQPWVSTNNRLGSLWVDCLRRAVKSGFISQEQIEREIALGHIRPSLINELVTPTPDSIRPTRIDRNYTPPYKRLATFQQHSIAQRLMRQLRRFSGL